MPTTVKQTVTALDNAVAELTDRATRLAAQLDRALDRAETAERRLARGTADHTNDLLTAEWSPIPTRPDARPVMAAPDLAADLERILRAQPVATIDLATLLAVPVAHVAMAIRTLRRAKHIANAGTSDEPLWSWVLGDEGSTTELVAKVEQLLRIRPMSLAELGEITGARRNRLSGAIVLLRRHGMTIENKGNGYKALWSIPLRTRAARR